MIHFVVAGAALCARIAVIGSPEATGAPITATLTSRHVALRHDDAVARVQRVRLAFLSGARVRLRTAHLRLHHAHHTGERYLNV